MVRGETVWVRMVSHHVGRLADGWVVLRFPARSAVVTSTDDRHQRSVRLLVHDDVSSVCVRTYGNPYLDLIQKRRSAAMAMGRVVKKLKKTPLWRCRLTAVRQSICCFLQQWVIR